MIKSEKKNDYKIWWEYRASTIESETGYYVLVDGFPIGFAKNIEEKDRVLERVNRIYGNSG